MKAPYLWMPWATAQFAPLLNPALVSRNTMSVCMCRQVMIGNAGYQCSCVRYIDEDDLVRYIVEDDLDIGMIIGICIAVFIVTLFIIFLIFILVECVFCGRGKTKLAEPDDQKL